MPIKRKTSKHSRGKCHRANLGIRYIDTVAFWNKTNPSADEKRFLSTIAVAYLAQLRPPLILLRVRALHRRCRIPHASFTASRIDSINSFAFHARAMSIRFPPFSVRFFSPSLLIRFKKKKILAINDSPILTSYILNIQVTYNTYL